MAPAVSFLLEPIRVVVLEPRETAVTPVWFPLPPNATTCYQEIPCRLPAVRQIDPHTSSNAPTARAKESQALRVPTAFDLCQCAIPSFSPAPQNQNIPSYDVRIRRARRACRRGVVFLNNPRILRSLDLLNLHSFSIKQNKYPIMVCLPRKTPQWRHSWRNNSVRRFQAP